MMIMIIKVIMIVYMIGYSIFHVNSISTYTFLSGAALNILEFIITGGHFYCQFGSVTGFYINHASSLGIFLGDTIRLSMGYFSIGDIIMGLSMILSIF